MVQVQLSEPHGAAEATPSPARLDHSSCWSYLHPPGSRISFFQQDPQQDTVPLDHGGSQALVQLVWPCHGQVSSLAPHSRTWQLVLPRGAPLCPGRMAAPGRGRAAVLLGCSVCLGVHGGPGGGSRAGKVLILLDTKPFPGQQCPQVCACAATVSELTTALPWSGEPGHLPAVAHLDHPWLLCCLW